jgi:hypothetical protein
LLPQNSFRFDLSAYDKLWEKKRGTFDISHPINQFDPGNPVNPINRFNSNNPFNPINEYNPKNPLNPINEYNPSTPFKPLNTPTSLNR